MVARLLLFIPHGGQIIVIHSPWCPDYCYSFPMVARLLLFIPHGGQIIVIHSPWWSDYCYSFPMVARLLLFRSNINDIYNGDV
jgi:hypothetical protein